MKKTRSIAVLVSLVAVLALGLAGCGKSSQSGQSQQASFKTQSTKKSDVKASLTKANKLWYVAGGINSKSNSGIEAYQFNKNGKVTYYTVNKYYPSLAAAKKANDLAKAGTLTYQLSTKSGDQTVIHFKGKASGIPMEQTITFKDTVSGTNKQTKLGLTGYHIDRNVDDDTTKAVMVTNK